MKTRKLNLLILLSLLFIFFPAVFPAPSAGPSFEEKFGQGVSFYKKEDYSTALKTFQQIEQEFKDNRLLPDAVFMQGQALRALGNWAEAAKTFSRAAEVHPLLPDYALFFQGEALEKMGEGEKGITVLQSLVSQHPQSLLVPQALQKIAELNLRSGNYSKTLEIGERLLKGNGGKDFSAQARFLLGQAREGLAQWPEAIKTYQELWLKNPLNPLAVKAKDRSESLAREKAIPAEKIPPEALFQRALQFYRANSIETALAEMSQIEGYPLRSYPAQEGGEPWVDDLYFHRGMCYFRLKQYSTAVETFDLIVRNSRHDAAAEKSLFWMFQALARSGQKEEALRTYSLLQASYPRSPFMAQALYLEAAVYEEMGETAKAVSLYREMAEKFPQSSFRLAALWNAGWLLYQNKDYEGAVQSWDRLKGLDPNFRWMEKVLYWKGRTLGKMGKTLEAEESFGQLLKNFPTSYYSQLVSSGGRTPAMPKGAFSPLKDQPLSPFWEGEKSDSPGSKIYRLEKGRLLLRLTFLPLAAGEFEAMEEEGTGREEIWMEVSRLYREAEEYYRSNLLVRKKFSLKSLPGSPSDREKALYLLAYPTGNPSLVNRYAQAQSLDPALLCALILEESRFHSQALSPAGARGLMQIMPPTGKRVAKELKIQRFSADQLFEPTVNIRLGSWYLAKLLEEFQGKIPLALAAYNAGPHMVRKWLASGRSAAEDEFVENIPYSETRNYVIRVLSSAQVYRALYWPPKN